GASADGSRRRVRRAVSAGVAPRIRPVAAAGLRHRVAAHHALGAQRAAHAVVAAVSTVGGDARRTARRGADGAGEGARHVSGRTELVRGVGLVKWFGGIVANDAVDFVVAEGDLVGLIGPNGSGKTTLINLLTGHLAADGGEVRVRGQRVSGRPPHVYAAMGVARTVEVTPLCRRLTVLGKRPGPGLARPPASGRKIADGAPDTVRAEQAVLAAYAGL